MHSKSVSVLCMLMLCVYLCTANPIVDHRNNIRTQSNHLIGNGNKGNEAFVTSKVHGKDAIIKESRYKKEGKQKQPNLM